MSRNSYRYRGYRCDTETGLYYLQSRYYNPSWGRFINADALVGATGELLGHNMFAYCKNNFVNKYDPSGFYQDDMGIAENNGCVEEKVSKVAVIIVATVVIIGTYVAVNNSKVKGSKSVPKGKLPKPTIDINGNIVPWDSGAAHWPIK